MQMECELDAHLYGAWCFLITERPRDYAYMWQSFNICCIVKCLLSASGERPFRCDLCEKTFTLKHSMLRHRTRHTRTGGTASDEEAATSSAVNKSKFDSGCLDLFVTVTYIVLTHFAKDNRKNALPSLH